MSTEEGRLARTRFEDFAQLCHELNIPSGIGLKRVADYEIVIAMAKVDAQSMTNKLYATVSGEALKQFKADPMPWFNLTSNERQHVKQLTEWLSKYTEENPEKTGGDVLGWQVLTKDKLQPMMKLLKAELVLSLPPFKEVWEALKEGGHNAHVVEWARFLAYIFHEFKVPHKPDLRSSLFGTLGLSGDTPRTDSRLQKVLASSNTKSGKSDFTAGSFYLLRRNLWVLPTPPSRL